MMVKFKMSDLGKLSYFLGMEFLTTSKGIIIHKRKYATDVLKRFSMIECNLATTLAKVNLKLDATSDDDEEVDPTLFKQLIGCLRYLCNSRTNIALSIGLVSRYMSKPRKSHLMAAKRILRYINDTLEYGVLFSSKLVQQKNELIGYSNSDWCGDKSNKKSTSGYVFKFLEAPISWCSKKKPVVVLSTCEAEYIAGDFAACQAMWLVSVLKKLKIEVKNPIQLLVDNKSTIDLPKNPVSHGRLLIY